MTTTTSDRVFSVPTFRVGYAKVTNPTAPNRRLLACSHQTFDILNALPGVDIDGSLDYLAAHGGHYDCEIILNIILAEQPTE